MLAENQINPSVFVPSGTKCDHFLYYVPNARQTPQQTPTFLPTYWGCRKSPSLAPLVADRWFRA